VYTCAKCGRTAEARTGVNESHRLPEGWASVQIAAHPIVSKTICPTDAVQLRNWFDMRPRSEPEHNRSGEDG
jgi:hypothetical protein